MKTLSSLTTSLFLVCTLTMQAAAQQTSNTPTSKADPMAVSLSVAVRSQPLEDLLRQWNEKTNSNLTTEEAKWERVSLFAKKQPLSRLMLGVKTLFDYNWLPTSISKPPTGYKLVPSRSVRQYEQDLWRQTLEQAAAPLFRLPAYLKTPAAEYKRLREKLGAANQEPKDPLLRGGNLYYLGKSAPRTAVAFLPTLSAKQRLALLLDQRLFVPWNEMDAQQQELATSLARFIGQDRVKEVDAALIRKGEKVEDSIDWLKQFGLVLYVGTDALTNAVTTYGYGLGGGSYAGAQFDAVPRPSESLLPVRGNPYAQKPHARPPVYPEMEQAAFPKEFHLTDKTYAWSQVMEELSKYVSLPLFSDDYAAEPTPDEHGDAVLPDLSKLSLAAGLDALCKRYHRLWWRENGMLFFRSRTWFIERQYEVDPAVPAMLQKQLETTGKLDTQAIDLLTTLTPQQLEGLNALATLDQGQLRRTNPNIFQRIRGGDLARNAYDYLQVWAMLDQMQKDQALSAQGLSVAEMSPPQRQAILHILFLDTWSEIQAMPADPRFRVTLGDCTMPGMTPPPFLIRVGLECTFSAVRPAFAAVQVSCRKKPVHAE
jgi:hypothetical protein